LCGHRNQATAAASKSKAAPVLLTIPSGRARSPPAAFEQRLRRA
jgi:hypothetical protein